MTREGGAREGGAREDELFAALANATRRQVLRLLRDEGPQPVRRLAARFDMRRPSLSEHLRVLRDAGLVSERRVGRERHYRLECAPLTHVRYLLAAMSSRGSNMTAIEHVSNKEDAEGRLNRSSLL